MIIPVVHQVGVAALKPEHHPPIAGHFHRPMALQIAFQRVQPGTRKSHILNVHSGVQSVQNVPDFLRLIRPNSPSRTIEKEAFEAFVREAFDHSEIVTLLVTPVKTHAGP